MEVIIAILLLCLVLGSPGARDALAALIILVLGLAFWLLVLAAVAVALVWLTGV